MKTYLILPDSENHGRRLMSVLEDQEKEETSSRYENKNIKKEIEREYLGLQKFMESKVENWSSSKKKQSIFFNIERIVLIKTFEEIDRHTDKRECVNINDPDDIDFKEEEVKEGEEPFLITFAPERYYYEYLGHAKKVIRGQFFKNGKRKYHPIFISLETALEKYEKKCFHYPNFVSF